MKKKLLVSILAIIFAGCCAFALSACSDNETGKDEHTHTADTYALDEDSHWKVCTVCGEEFAKDNHIFGQDNTCSVCGYSTNSTEGLEYSEIKDGGGNINAYSVSGIGEATDTKIFIPSYYNGNPVTSIGDYAFSGCNLLTSITIPAGITSIGENSFVDCGVLEKIYFTGNIESWCRLSGLKNLMSLRNFAGTVILNPYPKQLYIGGQELTRLIIPDDVTSIDNSAFAGCSGLTSVTIPDRESISDLHPTISY